jgi:glycosyltransferase involved in cell wall biosynthesis
MKPAPRRILFVTHGPRDPRSAVFSYILQRGRLLEADGWHVDIVSLLDFASLRRVPPQLWTLAFPLRLAAWLARQRVDVVVFHSFSGWIVSLLRSLGPWRGIRSIVTQFHGVETIHYLAIRAEQARTGTAANVSRRHRLLQERIMPAMLRVACRGSDAVFCLNERERGFLEERGWTPRQRTLVVPNGIDRSFLVDPARDRNATRLLFVGTWIEGKGWRYLAAAMERLAAAFPDIELWCVGTRLPADTTLRAFTERVRGQVKVVPDIDRPELLHRLSSCGVFVFPSLSEGSSLALLEAMAAGLAIVTTPVGAAPDLLVDERSALIVPPADAGAIVAAVTRLLTEPGLATALGRSARGVAEGLTLDRLAPSYVGLMSDLAAGRTIAANP